jgi:hypothetical protein
MLGYLILFLTFVLLFGMSFYFAFREWLRPEDNTPIPVDVEYVRVENYFGTSFRAKMQEWLETAKPVATGEPLKPPVEAILEKPNRERILLLNSGRFGGDAEHDELLCCDGDLQLADHSVFLREIYSRGKVEGGPGVQMQALAADRDVTLGPGSEVARWIDAVGKIWLQKGTTVHARVSSQESIQLDSEVSSQSLYAPLIFTTGYKPIAGYTAPEEEALANLAEMREGVGVAGLPAGVARLAADTLLVRGDLELKPQSRVESNLIVQGTLRSGPDCVFLGDVKAGMVELGPRNEVSRNLVSGSTLKLGESCRVAKSVVAETDIILAPGSRVGQPGKMAVVSGGHDVRIDHDVAIWGKVAAGKLITTV